MCTSIVIELHISLSIENFLFLKRSILSAYSCQVTLQICGNDQNQGAFSVLVNNVNSSSSLFTISNPTVEILNLVISNVSISTTDSNTHLIEGLFNISDNSLTIVDIFVISLEAIISVETGNSTTFVNSTCIFTPSVPFLVINSQLIAYQCTINTQGLTDLKTVTVTLQIIILQNPDMFTSSSTLEISVV